MKYFFIALLVLWCNAARATPDTLVYRDSHAVADTDTIIKKSSVSLGVNYGTDALFFGRTGRYRYPFLSSDLVINYKSGFFVYGSVLKVLGYNPFLDEIDVGGGYFYRVSKKYTGTISYTRFVFNNKSEIIKSASTNDINFKNSYDWKYLKTSVIGDFLFGKSNDVFITINNSKYFESNFSVFDDQDFLSINPGVSIILGTQNFVQRYSVDHQHRLETDNIYVGEPGEGARNSLFNALNYSFKIPVAYNRPHYTLEASYKYSIPVNVDGVLRNRRESFFNLTFYYVFFKKGR